MMDGLLTNPNPVMTGPFPPPSSSSSQKRKELDELLLDPLGHVALSPHKKLRLDNGLPTVYEETLVHIVPDNQPIEIELPPAPETEYPVHVPEEPAISLAGEKAIVLYKPVNPPLFPGGPATGSDGFPIKVDARYFGESNGISSLLFPSKNFQQLSSFSSTNSAFPNSLSMPDNTGQLGGVSHNSLAMIPWVPSHVGSIATVTQLGVSSDKNDLDGDMMPMDDGGNVEYMEEDDATDNSVPPSNPAFSFSVDAWQPFGALQPPHTRS